MSPNKEETREIKRRKLLVACEFSQIVTKALRAVGHEAYSCDLLPTEGNPEWHIQRDVLQVSYNFPWDGMIAHPECTHLTLAGARWFYDPRFPNKHADREEAINFWLKLKAAPIKYKAFENPQPLLCGNCRCVCSPMELRMNVRIVTSYIHPPIPVRFFDWLAHYDDEGGVTGTGKTEQEAIADLIDNHPRCKNEGAA